MPFLRFSRDKRGYETTTLVEPVHRDGRSSQRVLYLFRTPPGVRVGRPALDPEAIEWIEAHHPDVVFDWRKILSAKPPPPPAAEASPRKRRDNAGRQRRASVLPQTPAEALPPSAAPSETAEPEAEPEAVPVDEIIDDLEESAAEAAAAAPAAEGPRPELKLRKRRRRRRRKTAERGTRNEPGTRNQEPGT